ncbi:hypothetical protein LTR95_011715 [Oleoguttula sp. CCFEE 5521]
MDPEVFPSAMAMRYDQRTRRMDARENPVRTLRGEHAELLADMHNLRLEEQVTRASQQAARSVFATPEILSLILQQLNIVDLLSAHLVCKYWKQAIESHVTLLRILDLEPDYDCAARTLSPHTETADMIDIDEFDVMGPPQFRIFGLMRKLDRPVGKLMQNAFITQPPIQHITVKRMVSDSAQSMNSLRI